MKLTMSPPDGVPEACACERDSGAGKLRRWRRHRGPATQSRLPQSRGCGEATWRHSGGPATGHQRTRLYSCDRSPREFGCGCRVSCAPRRGLFRAACRARCCPKFRLRDRLPARASVPHPSGGGEKKRVQPMRLLRADRGAGRRVPADGAHQWVPTTGLDGQLFSPGRRQAVVAGPAVVFQAPQNEAIQPRSSSLCKAG